MLEEPYCSRRPITTESEIKRLLADTGGQRYYQEMESLGIDRDILLISLRTTLSSRIQGWLYLCAHCGMCATACHFWHANAQSPDQIPAKKIASALGELIRSGGMVDNTFMRNAMETAWGKCTCCSRCAQFCPFGIDTGVMMSYLRGLLFEQGFVPWELKIGAGMHRVYGSQMDVSSEDWLETCRWIGEEYTDILSVAAEASARYGAMYTAASSAHFDADTQPADNTIRPDQASTPVDTAAPVCPSIPVEKKDAHILYVASAREAKHYPEDLAQSAALFQLAGEDWTVPATGWDQSSISMVAGDWVGTVQNLELLYGAIERLNPRQVVGTECGQAHRAAAIEGPYLMGREDGKPPAPILHFVEWAAEALRTGKLKVNPAKKLKVPCTFQDSCHYIRNGGLAAVTREIMAHIADDFREMQPHAEYNYCCGGGAGLNGIGIYRRHRDTALALKRKQIADTGAALVITPCHNCWDALHDMERQEPQGLRFSFLKPLLLHLCT